MLRLDLASGLASLILNDAPDQTVSSLMTWLLPFWVRSWIPPLYRLMSCSRIICKDFPRANHGDVGVCRRVGSGEAVLVCPRIGPLLRTLRV